MFNYHIKQWLDGICFYFPVMAHPTIFSCTVCSWEIQLILSSSKVKHQIKYSFVYFFWSTVFFIDFINNYDWLQTKLNCFLQYETSLRHWTFKCVNKKQRTFSHVQYTLYLSTEVTVTWCVDNIDFVSFILD